MVRGQESPVSVQKYIKSLKPIKDFGLLKEGQKIFNKQSLSVDYVDIFVSYDVEKDIVEYKNCKGETWRGAGKGYWYFIE